MKGTLIAPPVRDPPPFPPPQGGRVREKAKPDPEIEDPDPEINSG
jgi:hypothetical protein